MMLPHMFLGGAHPNRPSRAWKTTANGPTTNAPHRITLRFRLSRCASQPLLSAARGAHDAQHREHAVHAACKQPDRLAVDRSGRRTALGAGAGPQHRQKRLEVRLVFRAQHLSLPKSKRFRWPIYRESLQCG